MTTTTTAAGVRIGWADLPADVRQAVERILGDVVVEAVSQPGGFSPGTADRVVTAAGRRAFVKAVSPDLNDESPVMHRREAVIAAALPASAPAPRLLGTYDDGHWIVLVLDDVEGRHPVTPWQPDELRAVLTALDRLAAELTPSPLNASILAEDRLLDAFAGWDRVAADPPASLDPWWGARLDLLGDRSARARELLTSGDTLVHTDLRADNLLITPAGEVVVVDWPHARNGPAWLDTVLLLINVRLFGGHDTQALLTERAAVTGADPQDLIAVLTASAGYFVDCARQPAPVGLPTLRSFQQAQADALLGWLREPGAGLLVPPSSLRPCSDDPLPGS